MEVLIDWGQTLSKSLSVILGNSVDMIPAFIVAVIVFIVGIFLAEKLGRIITKVLSRIYVDKAVEKAGLKRVLEKFGFRLSISRALGLLITWFLYAVVLIMTVEILNLDQISQFLQKLVLFIPNVIVAIVILIVGIIIANFIHTVVKEASLAAKIEASDFLASVAKWAILVFTFMAALVQLRVATELITILFTGLVFMFALAGGIAFGLGGKDKARELLDKIGRK